MTEIMAVTGSSVVLSEPTKHIGIGVLMTLFAIYGIPAIWTSMTEHMVGFTLSVAILISVLSLCGNILLFAHYGRLIRALQDRILMLEHFQSCTVTRIERLEAAADKTAFEMEAFKQSGKETAGHGSSSTPEKASEPAVLSAGKLSSTMTRWTQTGPPMVSTGTQMGAEMTKVASTQTVEPPKQNMALSAITSWSLQPREPAPVARQTLGLSSLTIQETSPRIVSIPTISLSDIKSTETKPKAPSGTKLGISSIVAVQTMSAPAARPALSFGEVRAQEGRPVPAAPAPKLTLSAVSSQDVKPVSAVIGQKILSTSSKAPVPKEEASEMATKHVAAEPKPEAIPLPLPTADEDEPEAEKEVVVAGPVANTTAPAAATAAATEEAPKEGVTEFCPVCGKDVFYTWKKDREGKQVANKSGHEFKFHGFCQFCKAEVAGTEEFNDKDVLIFNYDEHLKICPVILEREARFFAPSPMAAVAASRTAAAAAASNTAPTTPVKAPAAATTSPAAPLASSSLSSMTTPNAPPPATKTYMSHSKYATESPGPVAQAPATPTRGVPRDNGRGRAGSNARGAGRQAGRGRGSTTPTPFAAPTPAPATAFTPAPAPAPAATTTPAASTTTTTTAAPKPTTGSQLAPETWGEETRYSKVGGTAGTGTGTGTGASASSSPAAGSEAAGEKKKMGGLLGRKNPYA